jgi:ribosome-binding protein aMBF1 (putative translation factor)
MNHQDWKTVVFKKTKKLNFTTKKQNHYQNTHKEDAYGMPVTKGLPKGFGKKLQQARSAKGLTQKELAAKVGERVQLIKDYETEKVFMVNNCVIQKLERHLGKLK